MSRRFFLGSVTAGVALAALNGRTLRAQDPSDQVVVGMIGVGNMGSSRLNEFLKHPDVRIGSICDVDSAHVDRAVETVQKARGYRPKTAKDYRHLLDDREIDAVVIATPDHWHAIPTVRAFAAEKDVFVEKPLSYSIAEGRAMADASSKYKRVSQMGNHIHNDHANYRRVVELVQSGSLGRITRAHCWRLSPTEGVTPPPSATQPATLDYDFWLGPAPKRPYHPLRSHLTFRHFWDYSGGTFIDFWCHIVDVAVWALDLKAPRSVDALGGRYFVNDGTETPDTVEAVLDYEKLLLMFSFRPTPLTGFEEMGSIGCLFEGTEASLVTSYSRHAVYVKGKKVEDFPRPAPSIPDSPGHSREFVDAIKSRNIETTCNVRYGHRLTKPGLLANIAYRTGRRIHWDDQREQILDDNEASRYLRRNFRKGYRL